MSSLNNSAHFLALLLTVLWFNSPVPLSLLSLAGTYGDVYAVKLVLISIQLVDFIPLNALRTSVF